MKMKTRKDYMSGVVTHREYYGQFVNNQIKQLVSNSIGMKSIINSKDKHLNDIELSRWNRLSFSIKQICGDKLRLINGPGGVSLSDTVCVAKEAAKQIKDEA